MLRRAGVIQQERRLSRALEGLGGRSFDGGKLRKIV
jgi:hypothetical protein